MDALTARAEMVMDNLDKQIALVGNNAQGLTSVDGPMGAVLQHMKQIMQESQLPETFKDLRVLLKSLAVVSGKLQFMMPDAEHLIRYSQEFMRNLSQQPGSLIHGLRKQE